MSIRVRRTDHDEHNPPVLLISLLVLFKCHFSRVVHVRFFSAVPVINSFLFKVNTSVPSMHKRRIFLVNGPLFSNICCPLSLFNLSRSVLVVFYLSIKVKRPWSLCHGKTITAEQEASTKKALDSFRCWKLTPQRENYIEYE